MNFEQESEKLNLISTAMKTILYFTALLISSSLFGCKPKETTLTGQAFIVTRGGENIKLGLVEVTLIDKESVKGFIQSEQPAIDAVIAARQHEYEAARQQLNTTNSVTDGKSEFGDYWRSVTYETNYLALIKVRENCESDLKAAEQEEPGLRRKAENSRLRYLNRSSRTELEALLDERAVDLNKSDQDRLASNVKELSKHIDSIKKEVAEVERRLNATPSAEIYFKDFQPSFLQKTFTDADGKFSFSYTFDKSFTIFATAERLVGGKTEKYYWLVDAPAGVEKSQLFLSNNNLVTIDPDGYFKTKPKSEVEEFTPEKIE